MKCCKILFLFFFLSSLSVFSQEKYKKHTVAKGETISEIAKKYKITSSSIYELNPDAANGIKLNTVLLIPTNESNSTLIKSKTVAQLPEKIYEVQPKETVYGIAKQGNISVADLYKINPDLEKEGLKVGQKIKIPNGTSEELQSTSSTEKSTEITKGKVVDQKSEKTKLVSAAILADKASAPLIGITHEVLAKESYYSIAKKYDIKLIDLQIANPEFANKQLKVGQKINVPVQADDNLNLAADKKVATQDVKKEMIPSQVQSTIAQSKQIVVTESKNKASEKKVEVILNDTTVANTAIAGGTHEVLAGQTLYSIAKQMNLKVSDLQKENPAIGNKPLKVGQKINVPVKDEVVAAKSAYNTKSDDKEVGFNDRKVVVKSTDKVDEAKAVRDLTHEVLPKETKYGIAKQYGLSVSELEKQNPSIAKKLLVGSMLKIQTSKVMEVSKMDKDVVSDVVVNKGFVANDSKNETTNVTTAKVHDAVFVDELISKASERLGTPYRSGGTSESGFDCSGLMCYTFSGSNLKLPRSSSEMAAYGSKIENDEAQKGDLIFFKTRGSSRINHVGMVVEVLDGEIKFIHSASHGGVIISSTKESYYQKNLVQVNRVL